MMGGWWGTLMMWVLLGKKEGGMLVFARGQKYAAGVSVFAFVLFWSDIG